MDTHTTCSSHTHTHTHTQTLTHTSHTQHTHTHTLTHFTHTHTHTHSELDITNSLTHPHTHSLVYSFPCYSLRRQVSAINKLSAAGMHLLGLRKCLSSEVTEQVPDKLAVSSFSHRILLPLPGADVSKPGAPAGVFTYPSYVQHIMG